MNPSDAHEVIYNQALNKIIGLFCILDPNRKHICSYHIYRLVCVVISAAVTCLMFSGILGIFINVEESADTFQFIWYIFEVSIFLSSLLKMNVLVYKADSTWDLLDITRIHFLSISYCKINEKKLKECQSILIHFTNFAFRATILMLFVYTMNPLTTNSGMKTSGNSNQKLRNILNIPYPVNAETYNKYYFVFFIMESIILAFNFYSILIDMFFLSISFIIIHQYEILAHTFERIGTQVECDNGKFILVYSWYETYNQYFVDSFNT